MDDPEFKKVCKPWMLKGLEQLAQEAENKVYTTKEVIDLESTADTEVWDPSEFIREIVPNFDNIEVELVTGKLNDLNKKLIQQGDVGLVVMGSDISRNSKPALIVLTTNDKLYAIDANDSRGIDFLRIKLKDPNIRFWTTNGLNEADSLYHNYKINLIQKNINCCTGLHIYLMQTMGSRTGNELYPDAARRFCRNLPRIESFEFLVETWLDIDKGEIFYETKQLAHLNSRPLNSTAINIIKKRCILVGCLIKVLNYFSWLEIKIMSDNAFDRITRCCENEELKKMVIKGVKKREGPGKIDPEYFIHLNNGDAKTERKTIPHILHG